MKNHEPDKHIQLNMWWLLKWPYASIHKTSGFKNCSKNQNICKSTSAQQCNPKKFL